MLKRIANIPRFILICSIFSGIANADLPEGCESPVNAFEVPGDQATMAGNTWTDVIKTRDGNYILVSAKRSKAIVLNNSGLIVSEFQLPSQGFRPTQVAAQPNGRILIAGVHTTSTSNGKKLYEVQVHGFKSDGQIDREFSHDGVFRFGSVTGYVNIAIRCDGQIYLAFDHGYYVLWKLRYEFVVARLSENGHLDTQFGVNGTSAFRIGKVWNSPETLRIRPTGAVLVGGQAHIKDDWVATMFQVTPDGHKDLSFGDGNAEIRLRSFSSNSSVRSVAVDDENNLVSVGFDSWSQWISLAKHLANGTFDRSFGSNGIAYAKTPSIQGANQFFSGNVIHRFADGQYLIGGQMKNPSNTKFWYLVAKFNSKGELNAGFGTNGFVAIPLPDQNAGGELIGEDSGNFVVIAEGRQPEAAMVYRFDVNGKATVLPEPTIN